jgi:hypothetical protein
VCARESMCVVGIEIVHWVREKECVRDVERERERGEAFRDLHTYTANVF